jgi:hypothetical protein
MMIPGLPHIEISASDLKAVAITLAIVAVITFLSERKIQK